MSDIFVTQLLEEAMTNVDVALVVALMAVGFIIKHFKIFENIKNEIIPPVLLVFSIVLLLFRNGFAAESFMTTIVSAIINAAVAIGLHQQGKNIFTITIVPSIGNLISNLFKNEEPELEEEFVEDVEELVINEETMDEEIDETVEADI